MDVDGKGVEGGSGKGEDVDERREVNERGRGKRAVDEGCAVESGA